MIDVVVLAVVILVGAVLALYRKHSLIAQTVVGLTLRGLAIARMLWVRVTFGMRSSFHATANPTAGGLVSAGPYRFSRNPIYAVGAALRLDPSFLTAGVRRVRAADETARALVF